MIGNKSALAVLLAGAGLGLAFSGPAMAQGDDAGSAQAPIVLAADNESGSTTGAKTMDSDPAPNTAQDAGSTMTKSDPAGGTETPPGKVDDSDPHDK